MITLILLIAIGGVIGIIVTTKRNRCVETSDKICGCLGGIAIAILPSLSIARVGHNILPDNIIKQNIKTEHYSINPYRDDLVIIHDKDSTYYKFHYEEDGLRYEKKIGVNRRGFSVNKVKIIYTDNPETKVDVVQESPSKMLEMISVREFHRNNYTFYIQKEAVYQIGSFTE